MIDSPISGLVGGLARGLIHGEESAPPSNTPMNLVADSGFNLGGWIVSDLDPGWEFLGGYAGSLKVGATYEDGMRSLLTGTIPQGEEFQVFMYTYSTLGGTSGIRVAMADGVTLVQTVGDAFDEYQKAQFSAVATQDLDTVVVGALSNPGCQVTQVAVVYPPLPNTAPPLEASAWDSSGTEIVVVSTIIGTDADGSYVTAQAVGFDADWDDQTVFITLASISGAGTARVYLGNDGSGFTEVGSFDAASPVPRRYSYTFNPSDYPSINWALGCFVRVEGVDVVSFEISEISIFENILWSP